MIELIDANGKKLASGHVVEDGQNLRVSMTMMDGAPPDVAAITKAAMADAPHPQAAMHRPGSAVLADTDRAARDKALDARDKRLVDAWKHPSALDAAAVAATQPTTSAQGSASDRRDQRLQNAWKMGAN